MSGVYTKLAQKRVEQSKAPVTPLPVLPTEQNQYQATTPLLQTPEEKGNEPIPDTKKSESQKVNKLLGEGDVRKSESQQNDLSENQHADMVAISTKTAKRFTTYLRKSSLRAIRIIADDEDRHDYEVFQEAIDFYIEHRKK
jgi:hypothetical protein